MNQTDDYFSQYLAKQPSLKQNRDQPNQIIEFEQPENDEKEFSFDDYTPNEFPEESKFDSLLRQSTQYASRALERLGGIGKDTKDFVGRMIIDSYEKATIGNSESLGKPPEKQREAPEWLKSTLGQTESPFIGGFTEGPSSEELKQFSEDITQDYTKPRTYAEEKIGNTVGDIASSLLGGNRSVKNNLLVPIGANLAESLFEKFGAKKDKAALGKAASWFLLGSAANVNANRFASQLQEESRSALQPGTQTNISSLGAELRPLNRKWLSGETRSSTAREQMNHIVKDLREGRTEVSDLMQRITDINDEIDIKNGFDYSFKTPPRVRKAEVKNLNILKSKIYNTIKESTKDQKGFFEGYMEAQQATGAIAQSNKMVDLARKHMGKFASAGLTALVGGAYSGHPIATAAASVSLLALHKAAQVGLRMAKSGKLRKYYTNSISAMTHNNLPVFIQNMQKLDRALKKQEDKEKPPFKSRSR